MRQSKLSWSFWQRIWKGAAQAVLAAAVLACTASVASAADPERADRVKAGQTAGVPWIFKWEQFPDLDTSGLDVAAQWPETEVVLADDFFCMESGPISLIYVWGSWLWDELPAGDEYNVSFTLSIHEDIPVGPGGYSIPGDILWMREFHPGEFVAMPYAMDLMEGWYNPLTGYYEPWADSICWLYQFHVPPGEEFIQQGGGGDPIVYWLDVQASPHYESYFGWKTASDHWNDDATWGQGMDPPPIWNKLRYPFGHQFYGQPIDLAFAIYTQEIEGACCCAEGACIPMTQVACEGEIGCTYMGDYTLCEGVEACCHGNGECDDIDGICCSPIYNGVRQGGHSGCSAATEACCVQGVYPDDCVDVDPVCCDDVSGVPSPFGASACLGDSNRNDVNDACEELTGACCRGPFCSVETLADCWDLYGSYQGDGTDCGPPNPCLVLIPCCTPEGACIMTDHMDCVALGGDPQAPDDTCEKTVCSPIKWAQPPTFNESSPVAECFFGWDEIGIYHWGPTIADDWLCDSDQPVSDIHWWGTYDMWDLPWAPDNAPLHFVIGIWTDVPAGVDQPFSHPGELIWQTWVDRANLNERPVGCALHPDFIAPQEIATAFRYDFKVPREQWWFQDDACSIYWVSISPVYPIQEPGERGLPNMWGWLTREHFFQDDAVRILDPVAPEVGQVFTAGEPITDLGGATWDMSFVITTAEPGKWEQLPDLTTSGLHAHDWWDDFDDQHRWLRLADQWRCEGGRVTDLHWWGNYERDQFLEEMRGSGISHFHLSIHANDDLDCLPREPALWEMDVPIAEIPEIPTGWTNAIGDPIYFYEYFLPEPFNQTEGGIYWLDITSFSNEPMDPAVWRWQEASRMPEFSICPAAERGDSFPWHHIEWPYDPVCFSEMAFRITSSPAPDPPDPPPGEPGYDKVRYISFVPSTPGVQTAIRVTLTTMPPPYAGFSGQQMWVGEALEKCENGGVSSPPCPPVPLIPDGYQSANLQCTQHCMDFGSVGALHVTDDEIIPNAVYDVQMIECSSDPGNEANYSDPLTIGTSIWADLVKDCTTTPCGPPDGSTGIVDVTAILDKFKNLPAAVMKSRADIDPNLPDWLVNITDVTFCLDAFLGFTYPPPGWTGPGGCGPTGARVGSYSDSGCLGSRDQSSTEPCVEDDVIELTPSSGTLDVIHWNASYNCCQDDIKVSSSLEGSLLSLTEEEVPPGGYCDCICCFNVESTIVDLPPGTYTVEYCWLDYEQGSRCHTDDIVIP